MRLVGDFYLQNSSGASSVESERGSERQSKRVCTVMGFKLPVKLILSNKIRMFYKLVNQLNTMKKERKEYKFPKEEDGFVLL